MSLIKALLLALLVYFFYKVLVFSFRIKKAYKTAQNQAENNASEHEGDVTITNANTKEKKLDNDVGEYVNYEDVD
jgi:cbb3-type cytochrome oxidase subunit 3